MNQTDPLSPTGMLIVIPSRLGVGEPFSVKVKLRGAVREIPCAAEWNTPKPRLRGPFNLNVSRKIQFRDDCLPQWVGRLAVDGGGDLKGTAELAFDGRQQGAYPGDRSVATGDSAGPGRAFISSG